MKSSTPGLTQLNEYKRVRGSRRAFPVRKVARTPASRVLCIYCVIKMKSYFYIVAVLCVVVSAAPPAPPRLYAQHAPAHLQNINPIDYFVDNPEISNYYNQQKQGQINGANGTPSRLESLEPDSEVELIPGAQQPQQPPQQNPVSPNLPGLIPGQRVFIVHMPVPGYRPGTIGGYQPVYIVAAGAQGNPGYAANGYQNAVLLNPGGQAVISPFFGYPGAGVPQGPHSGLLVGGPLQFNRPFDQVYQDPAYAYHQPGHQGAEGTRGSLQLSQLVNLQGQQARPSNSPRSASSETSSNSESKRLGQGSHSEESKEATEPRRNARPTPPHAQIRNKL